MGNCRGRMIKKQCGEEMLITQIRMIDAKFYKLQYVKKPGQCVEIRTIKISQQDAMSATALSKEEIQQSSSKSGSVYSRRQSLEFNHRLDDEEQIEQELQRKYAPKHGRRSF